MSSLPSETVTGTSAAQDSGSSPRSMSRRHLNTWFAFTLYARATLDTLATGAIVSSTMRRFSDGDQLRRVRRLAAPASDSTMSTSSAHPSLPASGEHREHRTLTYKLKIA